MLSAKMNSIMTRLEKNPKTLSEESDVAAFDVAVEDALPAEAAFEEVKQPEPPLMAPANNVLDDMHVPGYGIPTPPNEQELMALMWAGVDDDCDEDKQATVKTELDVKMNETDDGKDNGSEPLRKPKMTNNKRKKEDAVDKSDDDEEEKNRQNFLATLNQELFAAFMHDTTDAKPWFGKIVNVKTTGKKKKQTMLEVHWFVPNEDT